MNIESDHKHKFVANHKHTPAAMQGSSKTDSWIDIGCMLSADDLAADYSRWWAARRDP